MQIAPQHKVAQIQIIEIPKVLLSSLEQNRDEEVTVFFLVKFLLYANLLHGFY